MSPGKTKKSFFLDCSINVQWLLKLEDRRTMLKLREKNYLYELLRRCSVPEWKFQKQAKFSTRRNEVFLPLPSELFSIDLDENKFRHRLRSGKNCSFASCSPDCFCSSSTDPELGHCRHCHCYGCRRTMARIPYLTRTSALARRGRTIASLRLATWSCFRICPLHYWKSNYSNDWICFDILSYTL